MGTVRKKNYIPDVMFKKNHRRKEKTSIFLFEKNVMIFSFKQKKDKNVVLFSQSIIPQPSVLKTSPK